MNAPTAPDPGFDAAFSEVILRHGFLGTFSVYGSNDVAFKAYPKYGFRRVTEDSLPPLTEARCPTCLGQVKVRAVREETAEVWENTFTDTHTEKCVMMGKLSCAQYPEHTDELGELNTVTFTGSLGDLIRATLNVAAELNP